MKYKPGTKVRFISGESVGDVMGIRTLTPNKIYELINANFFGDDINREKNLYCVINDAGYFCWHYTECFVSLKEEREEKLNKILNEK